MCHKLNIIINTNIYQVEPSREMFNFEVKYSYFYHFYLSHVLQIRFSFFHLVLFVLDDPGRQTDQVLIQFSMVRHFKLARNICSKYLHVSFISFFTLMKTVSSFNNVFFYLRLLLVSVHIHSSY